MHGRANNELIFCDLQHRVDSAPAGGVGVSSVESSSGFRKFIVGGGFLIHVGKGMGLLQCLSCMGEWNGTFVAKQALSVLGACYELIIEPESKSHTGTL